MEKNNVANSELAKGIASLTEELEASFENDIDMDDTLAMQKLQENAKDNTSKTPNNEVSSSVSVENTNEDMNVFNGRVFRTEEEVKDSNKSSENNPFINNPVENGRISVDYRGAIASNHEATFMKNNTVSVSKDEEPSYTFDNNDTATKETVQDIEKPFSTEDFLKNLTVDLNNIDIVDVTPMSDIKNVEFFLNKKSKTQIVAIQSGYVAYMEGLNYTQINSLVNSTLDEYALQLLLAQTIYECINTTSLGKISFDEWCNITSYYDLESFEYGMYLETFPGDTEFSVKCGSCGQVIPAKVNNDSLICSKNELTNQKVTEILGAVNNPKSVLKDSFIHKKKRIFLDDCKAIIDIKLPTIKEHLNFISSFNKTARNKAKHILALMIFFEGVYMVDIPKTLEKHKPCYYKVTDNNTISEIIGKLTYHDSSLLSDQINDFINQYSVQFKIRGFKCPSCQTNIRDIPIELESLLFFQMSK